MFSGELVDQLLLFVGELQFDRRVGVAHGRAPRRTRIGVKLNSAAAACNAERSL
jgi:hypothetical protein